MIDWDVQAVSDYLGVIPSRESPSPFHGATDWFSFQLPFPHGDIVLVILPKEGACQIRQLDDDGRDGILSAYIDCNRIAINNDPVEEGGDCLVISGKGGHVCVSKHKDEISFFFSMYGPKPVT